MKTQLKLWISTGLFLFLFAPLADAQILQSRDQVIKEYGEPFCQGVTETGDSYLYYKIPTTTKTSGKYLQRKVLFFKKFKDGTETCYKWKIIEPSSEAGVNISSFSRQLVQLDDLKWKDHDKGIIYGMQVNSEVCKITAQYDEGNAALARVYKVN